MNRTYVVVSGSLFGIIAGLHCVRLVNQWRFMIGPWDVPLWASWLGTVVPFALCLWAFRLGHRLGEDRDEASLSNGKASGASS